eukprot:jgi/Tetstr1/461077/TSEL_006224.t1
MSAINGFYRDNGAEPVAQGDLVSKVRKGLAASQVEPDPHGVRTDVPARRLITARTLRLAETMREELGPTWTRDHHPRILLFPAAMAVVVAMYVFYARASPALPIGGEGRSESSDGGMAASMAAQEMNAELHVGAVIIKTRRQLYTGAGATLMEAALVNFCEWKVKHNIKTATLQRLSKLMKKHMLPKDGPKVKPDPKPVAPAAKTQPTAKTDRKPAAPKTKAKSKSKVAPEPPKAKSKQGFVGQWEAAGADDAVVDMFEGTGPGCRGADVEPSTSGDPAIWLECEEAMAKVALLSSGIHTHMQVVHEKPETRRPVVFKHNTWDEQWVPTDEYGEHAIMRDRRAEVEQHDNDAYAGKVSYFMEVTHTTPSVPDLMHPRRVPIARS